MGILTRSRISLRVLLIISMTTGLLYLLVVRTHHKYDDTKDSSEKDISTGRKVASVPNTKKDKLDALEETIEEITPDEELKEAMRQLEQKLTERKQKQKEIKNKNISQKLPEPSQMVEKAKGPLSSVSETDLISEEKILQKLEEQLKIQSQICDKTLPIDTSQKKLLILAKRNSGFSVLSHAFGNLHGVFVHVDPLDEMLENIEDDTTVIDSLLYKLDNLLRCVIRHENFDLFKKFHQKSIERNELLRHACSKREDNLCVTSMTLLQDMCSRFPVHVVTSSRMSMDTARKLMLEDPTLNVLYLFRDPRAIAYTRSKSNPRFDFTEQSSKLCTQLQSDLTAIDKVRHDSANQLAARFHFLRYEDLALQPESELNKLISSLQNTKNPDGEDYLCRPSVDDLDQNPDWNWDQNPVERVNVWKQKLPIEVINAIEDECLNVLSQLEYHIIGKGD